MTKKKHIIFVNGHLNPGGVEKSLSDILRTIDPDKFEIELLLLEGFGDYVIEVPSTVKIRLLDLHNTYGSFISSVTRCLRQKDWICLLFRILFVFQTYCGAKVLCLLKHILFGFRRYDCAIGFRPGLCLDLVAYAMPASQKIGWWHHGSMNLSPYQLQQFVESCKCLDKLITVSHGCKEMIVRSCPQLQKKIQVIPNMIDIDSIKYKAELFHPYHTKEGQKIFVTVGRLSKEKHIENAIFAARKLKEQHYINFHWYIVGDGEEKNILQNLIDTTGTQDVVTLLGNQPNPYPYIKDADLLVHTSYIESQCLVVLEAMALKTLCVVTESLGVKEFIVNNENAILVKQNVGSLIDGIYKILFDKFSTMSANAYRTANSFSTNIISKQIENIFFS